MQLVDGYAQRWVTHKYNGAADQTADLCSSKDEHKQQSDALSKLYRLWNCTRVRELESHSKYSMALSQKLVYELSSLTTEVTFLCNNKPIHIAEREMRRLLLRVLNHLNAVRRIGTFLVDPLTGLIRFRQISQVIGMSASQILKLAEDTCEHLWQPLEVNLLRILEHSGLHQNGREIPNEESPVRLEEAKRLETIKRCIQLSTMRYPKEAMKENNRFQSTEKVYRKSREQDSQLDDLSLNYPRFQKYFLQPMVSMSTCETEPSNIYNNIIIKNPEQVEWQLLAQTNLSKIEKAKVTLNYANMRFGEYSKVLVRKTEMKPQTGRIQHEQDILETIRDNISPNFVRTFTDGSQDTLYSELSPVGTYHSYLKRNSDSLTILTKLFSLSQVLQGMLFLREKEITHMDLKPQNILIGKKLNMKLTDLGEAYHHECNKYQPGTSMPYSSPEAYQYDSKNTQLITSKSDVYSFGVMMMEELFSTHPITVGLNSTERLVEQFGKGTYGNRLIVNPISNDQYGPQPIMETLYSLAIRCFDPNPSNRPEIEWLIVVIREALVHLQRIY